MRVKELIEELSKYDREMNIYVDGYEFGIEELEKAKIRDVKVKLYENRGYYHGGEHEEVVGEDYDEIGLLLNRDI